MAGRRGQRVGGGVGAVVDEGVGGWRGTAMRTPECQLVRVRMSEGGRLDVT